jgi:hypothetical protein
MNPPAGRPLVWSWSLALLGALCSVPAVIVTVSQPSRGLALAFGVLPAAAVGIQGARRRRYTTLIPGVAIGACLTLGAALATHAALAISGVFLLALGSAMLAPRPAGRLLMVLALPMVGAGLSFTDVATAAELAGLMVLGSVYGWLLTLAWPERPAHVRAPPATPSRGALLDYGIRLGLAGALCTGVGFALDLDHKGWATAACLLVMRPTPEMTRLRGAGRALAVTSGALVACLLARADPPSAVLALTVSGALIGLAATRPSRWYVTGGFTTFLVISLLLYGNPQLAQSRFDERVLETLLGVGVALIFGVAIPVLRTRVRRSARSTPL